jgi:hypothetical protein
VVVFIVFFFFEPRKVPKDLKTLLYYRRWVTTLKEDLERKHNYNQVLRNFKKDPRSRKRNTIWPFSTAQTKPRSTTIFSDTGDETTWVRVDVERCAEAEDGPPKWRSGLEVEDELTKANSEQPPFGYEDRRNSGLGPTMRRR